MLCAWNGCCQDGALHHARLQSTNWHRDRATVRSADAACDRMVMGEGTTGFIVPGSPWKPHLRIAAKYPNRYIS